MTTECLSRDGGAELARDHLDLDRVAEFDVPLALREIREVRRDDAKVAVDGHCLGGAVVAQSLAEGFISSDDLNHLVLLTVGLFWASSVENRLKSLDRTLERVYPTSQYCVLDPHSVD